MSLLNESINPISTMNATKIGKTKYSLVLCELHYSPIHGKTHDSCPNIEEHYLIIEMFDGISGIILNDLYNSVEYVEYDTDPEYINSDSDDESYDESYVIEVELVSAVWDNIVLSNVHVFI